MTDGGGSGVINRLVEAARSADVASASPDDPLVRGFADFGLAPSSPLATDSWLRKLETWRANLQISANSAFLDGTLLLTVEKLLGPYGPVVLTPVTLWELTTFIDALVCFDRLYCISNPGIDLAGFNRRLGTDVLTAIPDPDDGMLRLLAECAAADGVSDMSILYAKADLDDAFRQEMLAVVNGWRAVLGADLPIDAPFDIEGLDTSLAEMAQLRGKYRDDIRKWEHLMMYGPPPAWSPISREDLGRRKPRDPLSSAAFADSNVYAARAGWAPGGPNLETVISATHLPKTPTDLMNRPPLPARQRFAANATYRTYVNQGIANALALPYLPGTLRMPFRRLFVERAAEVQDELVSVAVADQALAQRQPSSPLILPFFTASVLQRATTRDDVWAQMAQIRDQSVTFRRVRAEWDRVLERSQVSAEAQRIQSAIRDEAVKLADLAGAAQEATSVALGVVAQTGIVPLTGALKVGVDAANGIRHSGSWTRIWRRLFHRDEYFLAQTNSQAIALTNALPQLQQLWQMPKIGGYLERFASATQQMGQVLRG